MAEHEFQHRTELAAVLICPNRPLAAQFESAIPDKRVFNVIADVKDYPSPQTLETRLRQAQPDVLLLDLGSDNEKAIELISAVGMMQPPVYVVGLHSTNDAGLIIRSLRAGATEFLCSPFDLDSVTTVITRLLRLRESNDATPRERGKMFAFGGCKAGQGATTIAYNTAYELSQEGKNKVLLVDLDVTGGTVSFALRVTHHYSILDALRHADKMDKALWSALISTRDSVDLLLAPEKPELAGVEAHRISEILEFARAQYRFVVVDLPSIYDRMAHAVLGDADHAYLVSNPELPSLHLTRKALNYLEQMGLPREQFSLLVNRMHRRQELTTQDIEKVFNFPVRFVFPEDHTSTHRALTAGKPIASNCELGKGVRAFAKSLAPSSQQEKKKGAVGLKLTALLSSG
jgi:pilus assembly protein CpaE